MYLDHFGLKEYPFKLTPNTSFYVKLPSHSEAFEVLKTALDMGEGFIKVTGEVGTGKTLICRKLLNEMPEQFVAAYIPDPCLNPMELRRALAHELELPCKDEIDSQQLMHALQSHLVTLARTGKSVVLIVDEAQALPFESLEALRLFTNLETEQNKLVQVVLFGQTELDQRLEQSELRQLRQRITFSYKLKPLDEEQVSRYVDRRLITAGFDDSKPLFSQAMIKALTHASRGVPRLLNVLCHKALMLCYGQGKKEILRAHIDAAIADTEDVTTPAPGSSKWTIVGIFAVGFIAGLGAVWLSGGFG